jgi:hypothetical protein
MKELVADVIIIVVMTTISGAVVALIPFPLSQTGMIEIK